VAYLFLVRPFVKLPVALVVYVVLAFVTAAADLLGAARLAFTQPPPIGSIVASLLWAAFSVGLGFGILRLRPVWRIVALVCCWIVFAVFAISVASWCIWPQSVTFPTLVVLAAAAALNLWFYFTFRRDEVRALFSAHATRRV